VKDFRQICLEAAYVSNALRCLQGSGKGNTAEATKLKARKEQLRKMAGKNKIVFPRAACGHHMTMQEIQAELEEVKKMKIVIEFWGPNDVSAWFTDDINEADTGYSTRGPVSEIIKEIVEVLMEGGLLKW